MEIQQFASTNPNSISFKHWSNAYVETDTGFVYLPLDTTGSVVGDTGYYTLAATKLMLHAAFNPKTMLGLPYWSERDWRLYAEVALLGLANQPILYEVRGRRIAFMAGANLPSLGWLNSCEVAYEWHMSHDGTSHISWKEIIHWRLFSIASKTKAKLGQHPFLFQNLLSIG